MNICVTVNSKYVRYLYITLLSLYENNINGSIDLYVLQRDFTEEDKLVISKLCEKYQNRVHYIWVDETVFNELPVHVIENSKLSKDIFSRLLIPELLPEDVDRVLMLDVDIIVNKDISELYHIDFEGKSLAAAPNMCLNLEVPQDWREWYPENRKNWTQYNVGVLLFNLKKIREQYPPYYIFNFAKTFIPKVIYFEEETFNVLFGEDNIYPLQPEIWNYIITFSKSIENPRFYIYESEEKLERQCAIIHYSAESPWKGNEKDQVYKLWWEYAKNSPYYEELLEEFLDRADKNIKMLKSDLEHLQYVEKEYELERRKSYITVVLINKRKEFYNYLKIIGEEHICLYGAGMFANLAYDVLSDSKRKNPIKAVIDKKQDIFFREGIPVYQDISQCIEEQEPCLIIITPFYESENIKEMLKNIVPDTVQLYTLEEITKDML